MSIGIEHIILIFTTIAGVVKAYFEAQKAKAESMRAGQAEEFLKVAVEGVEETKKENPELGKKMAENIKKKTKFLNIDGAFNEIVQDIVEGKGKLHELTRKYSKTMLRQALKEEDIA